MDNILLSSSPTDRGAIIETVDFGRIEAGSKKSQTVYLHNLTLWPLKDVVVSIDDVSGPPPLGNVRLVESPTEVLGNSSGKIEIEWSTSITALRPLKCRLNITGVLYVG